MELREFLVPVVVMLIVMVVAGGIGYMAAGIASNRRRRLRRPTGPPSGTRPSVLLDVDDITYDVSDSLVRARNEACECALWVVIGPAHVRLQPGTVVVVRIQRPRPVRTHLSLEVRPLDDGTARFATAQEIEDILYPLNGS